MELHDILNPLIWSNQDIKSNVLKKMRAISYLWLKFVGIKKKLVKDIIFTGSNANYNYTKFSDIDIHVIVDKSDLECEEFIDEYIIDKKNSFSENYNITIYDYPVEMYIQDLNETYPKNQGIFSILKNSWIQKPEKINIYYNDEIVLNKTKVIMSQIKQIYKLNNIKKLQKIKERIRNYRKSGLESRGEFSLENLVFKNLRNYGIMDLIDKKINNLIHSKYSI